MTQEEKAKVYDETLERASVAHKDGDIHLKATLERIFPELKENDYNKIKNAILNHLKKMCENCQDDVCGVHVEDAINWFDDSRIQEFAKKLCSKYVKSYITPLVISNSLNTGKNEQKSIDKIKPKFKVGDWLCANELNNYANFIKIVKIVNVFGKKRYKISRDYYSDLDLTEFDFIEKYYHLFTIKDAKDGDVLVSKHNQPFIYNGNYNDCEVGAYCGIECMGKQFMITYSEIHWTLNEFIKPATREQRDTLMKAMNDAGYEWDTEKKELKKKVTTGD